MAFGDFGLLAVIGQVTEISTGAFPLRYGIGVVEHPRNSTVLRAPFADGDFKPLNPTVDVVNEITVIVRDVHMHATDEFINILGESGEVYCEVVRELLRYPDFVGDGFLGFQIRVASSTDRATHIEVEVFVEVIAPGELVVMSVSEVQFCAIGNRERDTQAWRERMFDRRLHRVFNDGQPRLCKCFYPT